MLALATPCDANAVRIDTPAIDPVLLGAAKRTVIVHLTPYAPGCGHASVGDQRRNRTYWDRPTAAVVRSLLTRLRRVPAQVRAITPESGDPTLVGDLAPYGEVPLAFFWEGVTTDEVNAVLAELHRRGWQLPGAAPVQQLRSMDSLLQLDKRERFRA